MPQRIVPEKYRFLSGSALKMLALTAMIIDHTALALLSSNSEALLVIFGREITLYKIMRTIGRIAFPIFVFLLTEGFHYTRDRNKYSIRLLIFAIISEVPYNLLMSGSLTYQRQNVFFTLFLGLRGLTVVERMEKNGVNIEDLIKLIVLFGVTYFLRTTYGVVGFGLVILMYILRERPAVRALLSSCFLTPNIPIFCSFVPIAFYSGKRGFIKGRTFSILFYAAYPIHILVLYLIKKIIG